MSKDTLLMDRNAIRRCLTRLAHEIVENNIDLSQVAIVGIRTRGVIIAERLAKMIERIEGTKIPVGALDITFNRDDLHMRLNQPAVHKTEIDFDITGKKIILVDDVLHTGRTIQAALEALKDFGRAHKVRLVAFIDRGFHQLPIRADYSGKEVKVGKNYEVRLLLKETDKTPDQLILIKKK